MKREKYNSWDETFIMMAAMISFRSKDPSTQNGSVIVDNMNRVVSMGYNGFPRIDGDNDETFPWTRPEKYNFVIHSEPNAILNAGRHLDGCRLYLYSEKGYYPCGPCATWIAQAGIKEVICGFVAPGDISESGTYEWGPTKKTFDAAGVKIRVIDNIVGIMRKVGTKILNESDKPLAIQKGE